MKTSQTSQHEVIGAVREERDYQDKRWQKPAHDHSNTEYLVYIDHYVKKGLVAASTLDGGDNGKETQSVLRRIAALAIAAMEENGVIRRADEQKEGL